MDQFLAECTMTGPKVTENTMWSMAGEKLSGTPMSLAQYPAGDPRYVIYARVSTKKQGVDGLGITAQLDACRRLVAKGILKDRDGKRTEHASGHGLVLKEVSEARSAMKGSQVELLELVEFAAKHGCAFVSYDNSRTGRDKIQRYKFEIAIKEHGVPLLYVDLNSEGLIGQFKGVMNEAAVLESRQKISMALRVRRQDKRRSLKEANNVHGITARNVFKATHRARALKSEIVFRFQDEVLRQHALGMSTKQITDALQKKHGKGIPCRASIYNIIKNGPKKKFEDMTKLERRALEVQAEKSIEELDRRMARTRDLVRKDRLVEVGRRIHAGHRHLSKSETVDPAHEASVLAVERYKDWCRAVVKGIIKETFSFNTEDPRGSLVSHLYHLGDATPQDVALGLDLVEADESERQFVGEVMQKA